MFKQKIIDGGYIVCSDGKIFSPRGRQLSKNTKQSGYIRLCINGKPRLLHRLIAEAFIPNPDNKPEVNHIDGNPSNNRVDNLEWVTHYENHLHAHRTGLIPEKNRMKRTGKFTLDGVLLETYISMSEAARKNGIRYQDVQKMCSGIKKSYDGYTYKIIRAD